MQLLASREYPVIDYQTMVQFIGHERLFRMPNGQFPLHLSSAGRLETEERVIWLGLRDAISWLNEPRRKNSVRSGKLKRTRLSKAVSALRQSLPSADKILLHGALTNARSFFAT
jgi:hypothetical protein